MISDLFTPVTAEESKAAIYGQLERMGVKTADWKPGAVVRTIVAVVAVLVATFSDLIAKTAAMGWLSTATGDWLTAKAEGDMGTKRIEPMAAHGMVRLTNTAGGSFSVASGDLIVGNKTTGAQYRNVASFSLGPLAVLDAEFAATEAGAWTSSSAGTITEMVTPLTGVTCSNPTTLVGLDAESDALLRQRAMLAPGANSPSGPADAYSYYVRTTPRADGSPTGITRARTISDTGTGLITVVAATASGYPLTSDLDYLQDGLIRQVLTECARVELVPATPAPIVVSYVAYTSNPAADLSKSKTAALAALSDYVGAAPIGGYRIGGATGTISRYGLSGAIQGAIPGCFAVDLLQPASDIDLAPNDVAALGVVTASVRIEVQP